MEGRALGQFAPFKFGAAGLAAGHVGGCYLVLAYVSVDGDGQVMEDEELAQTLFVECSVKAGNGCDSDWP